MTFRLLNVDGRAALAGDQHYYDLQKVSGGRLGPDPMQAVAQTDRLHELSASLGTVEATGALADVILGPPVPRPSKVFLIGLNYSDHAAEVAAPAPEVPAVSTPSSRPRSPDRQLTWSCAATAATTRASCWW